MGLAQFKKMRRLANGIGENCANVTEQREHQELTISLTAGKLTGFVLTRDYERAREVYEKNWDSIL
jgi:hypothetical protein